MALDVRRDAATASAFPRPDPAAFFRTPDWPFASGGRCAFDPKSSGSMRLSWCDESRDAMPANSAAEP